MMKEIVVATDLSPRTARAVERAAMLAKEQGAHLTVVSAVDDALPADMARDMAERAKAKIDHQLQVLAQKNGFKATSHIVFGRHFEAILDAANDARADLLVLGRHRKGHVRELFRGSTGERVIRYGRLPVLLVRNIARKPYKRILIGADFSPASERAAGFACQHFKDAALEICHAFDMAFAGLMGGVRTGSKRTAKDEAAIAAMVEEEKRYFLKRLGKPAHNLRFHHVIGQAEEVLRREVRRRKPDLLVLGTHGRGALARAVIGSVAENFLRDPPCDILVVRR